MTRDPAPERMRNVANNFILKDLGIEEQYGEDRTERREETRRQEEQVEEEERELLTRTVSPRGL